MGYSLTVRTDHKSISFLKNCKLSHGRLTRWTLALQEYNINWEYVPGKYNIAADVLSRVNIQNQTFEGERETVAKVYHIIKDRTELAEIINKIKLQQRSEEKLNNIRQRLINKDERVTPYYCVYQDVLFIKNTNQSNQWKLLIPKTIEKEITMDYHIRYGHMGAIKVIKALEENVYFKDINRRVRSYIRNCHLCQMVKCNNERKEGLMIPITSSKKLEKVFVDICGPLPRSGGRRQYKFIVIIFDHYTKYTRLYPDVYKRQSEDLIIILQPRFISKENNS